ncbi:PilT/PilU family type 4a pilus ATPase [candidate division KSB1 bacterium]|nr:PilT/PilU family type 4a pilus ATPase [candidate division KSB1 bacterium]
MLESIFTKILSQIPKHVEGLDRLKYMNDGLQQLTPQEIYILQNKYKEFLLVMRKLNASDIELGGYTSQNYVWFRVQGKKIPRHELGFWNVDQTDILCLSLISPKQAELMLKNRVVDFSFNMKNDEHVLRWRSSLYVDLGHLALNMRSIASDVYPYKKLGFHPNISLYLSLAHEKQGLVLLTGITGSGKSTTMDSIVDANNQTVNGHIVIIGDPIEFIHKSKKCIIRHREVGRDVLSFKDGAVQSLRQDPDIIVVGEMRDPETIMTCLEISDTGHKVFSTLHTGSAVETIDRIVAECPTNEQDRVRVRLADQLRVVISQKLVPALDQKLILAKEVLLVTSSVRAAIRNKNITEIYQMIAEGGKLGMHTLEQDLTRLAKMGKISEQVAVNYANNKKRIQELLN